MSENPSNKTVLSVGVALVSVVAGVVSALVSLVWEQQRDFTADQIGEMQKNLKRIESHLERLDARGLANLEGFAGLKAAVSSNEARIERVERRVDSNRFNNE